MTKERREQQWSGKKREKRKDKGVVVTDWREQINMSDDGAEHQQTASKQTLGEDGEILQGGLIWRRRNPR